MATSKQLTEQNLNESISSVADIPASHSVKPGNGPGPKMLDIFGQSSPDWFASFDHDTSYWKTSQATFLSGLDQFSETWPDSGSMRSGRVYEHRTSAHPILESASSLWPTAVAKDDGKTPEAHLAMKQRMGERDGTGANRTAITSLAVKVQAWPTPQAHDSHGAKTPEQIEAMRAKGHGVSNLNECAENWPTPDTGESVTGHGSRGGSIRNGHQSGVDLKAIVAIWKTPHGMSNRDFRGKVGGCGGGEFAKQANHWRTPDAPSGGGPRNRQASIGDGHQVTIAEQAEHWQTPATDSFRSRGGDRKNEMGLDQQARFFPTPSSRDYRTPNAKSYQERSDSKKGEQLNNFVEHSLPAPMIPDGRPSSVSTHGSPPPSKRRLNPFFVEWLMGFPIGFTKL